MDNADNQQNFSSKLSADVEPFVPRQYRAPVVTGHVGFSAPVYTNQLVQDIPSYITNCYPFVQEDYVRVDVAPDINQWLGSNYYHNVSVPPQQYPPNVQVPYSQLYQPCQYSQTYNSGSVKPKRSQQLRSQQSSIADSSHSKRNWIESSGCDVETVQKSLSYMNLANPGGGRKESREKAPPGRSLPPRSGYVKSSAKPLHHVHNSSSNNNFKDKPREAHAADSTKTSTVLEEDGQKDQSAPKGGRMFQLQNNSARYHNRTLGDFMLSIKTSKKGKNSTLPQRSEHMCTRPTASSARAAKASLPAALPSGFEIRNSDWPTAGNPKPNLNKEQRNPFFASSNAMQKPKTFADIIKSSPSKQESEAGGCAKESLPGWTAKSSRMSQLTDMNYFCNSGNGLSLTNYGLKNNPEEMFAEKSQHSQLREVKRNNSNSLIGHSFAILDENLAILQDYNSSGITEKSKNRRVHVTDYTNSDAHTQVPCRLQATSELELPKTYIRKFNDRLIRKDEKLDCSPFLLKEQLGRGNSIFPQSSNLLGGRMNAREPRTFSESVRTQQQAGLTYSDRNTLDKQVIRRPDSRNVKEKYAASVDRNKNDCNLVNRNAESLLLIDDSYSPNRNVPYEIMLPNCQNGSKQKGICLRRTQSKLAENSRSLDDTFVSSTVVHQSEQQQKSKKKKKQRTPNDQVHLAKEQMNALQGKMIVLSQDVYSKLTTSGTSQSRCNAPNVSSRCEDYPELGSCISSRKSGAVPKASITVDKCNQADDDQEWSDIDSDYESSTGLFGLNTLQDLGNHVLPIQCVKSGTQARMDKAALSSSGHSYSAALKKNSVHHIPTDYMSIAANSFLERNLECEDMPSSDKSKRLKKKKGKNHIAASGESHNLEDQSKSVFKSSGKKVKPKPHQPFSLDLGQMLAAAECRAKKQRKFPRVRGKESKLSKSLPVVANILDSSAPSRRRGKEREIPVKKQPSALKKVILKEREQRKQQRLEEEKRKRLLSGSSLSDNEGNNSQDSAWETQGSVSSATPSVADDEEETEKFSLPALAKSVIHSRRFREYCNHVLKPEVDQVATQLLQDLIRFHNRLYHKDPMKAKSRRRIVLGLREVTKHLKLKKLKCLILAPNLDRIKSKGGLDDAIDAILALAKEQNIPYVFALGRKALGKACLKQVPVSCVGIFNYSGSEKTFHHLMELVNEAQTEYVKVLQFLEKDLEPPVAEEHRGRPLSCASSSLLDLEATAAAALQSASSTTVTTTATTTSTGSTASILVNE